MFQYCLKFEFDSYSDPKNSQFYITSQLISSKYNTPIIQLIGLLPKETPSHHGITTKIARGGGGGGKRLYDDH